MCSRIKEQLSFEVQAIERPKGRGQAKDGLLSSGLGVGRVINNVTEGNSMRRSRMVDAR